MIRPSTAGLLAAAFFFAACAPSFPPPHMGIGLGPETHGTLGGAIAGSGSAMVRLDGGAAMGEIMAALGVHDDLDLVGHFQGAVSVNSDGILGGLGLRWQAYAGDPVRIMLAAGADGGLLAVDGRIHRGELDVDAAGDTDTAVAGPWGTFSIGFRVHRNGLIYIDNTYELLWNERFPETHWWIGTVGGEASFGPASWFLAIGGSYRSSSLEEGGGVHVGTGVAFHWGDGGHRDP